MRDPMSGNPEMVTKTGPGVWMLGGVNTYTGPTTVNGGALIVDGSIASSSLTTVNSGAALIGGGTVGSTVINSGGFLVPGPVAAIGTMTVAGNLAFQSGAFYVVRVNPATASNTNVSGTASLAGTVAAVFAPGAYTKQSYPILTAAGGLMGTRFDGLETHGLPPDFGARVNYVGNTAFLNLFAHLVPEPTPPTPTPPTTPPTLPTVPPPLIPPVPGLPPSEQPSPPDQPAAAPAAPQPIFTANQFTSATRSTTSSTTAGRCRWRSRRCSVEEVSRAISREPCGSPNSRAERLHSTCGPPHAMESRKEKHSGRRLRVVVNWSRAAGPTDREPGLYPRLPRGSPRCTREVWRHGFRQTSTARAQVWAATTIAGHWHTAETAIAAI
jgi:autotransporter-associated beta strand protein